MTDNKNQNMGDFEAVVERLFIRYGAGFDRLERRLDGISEQVNQVSSDLDVLRERTTNQNTKIDRIESDLRDVKSDFKQTLEEKLEQMRREMETADKQHASAIADLKTAYEAKIKTLETKQETALTKANETAVSAADYYAKINQMYKIFMTVSAGLAMLIIGGIWALLTGAIGS